jgi:hypothetical protein
MSNEAGALLATDNFHVHYKQTAQSLPRAVYKVVTNHLGGITMKYLKVDHERAINFSLSTELEVLDNDHVSSDICHEAGERVEHATTKRIEGVWKPYRAISSVGYTIYRL